MNNKGIELVIIQIAKVNPFNTLE